MELFLPEIVGGCEGGGEKRKELGEFYIRIFLPVVATIERTE